MSVQVQVYADPLAGEPPFVQNMAGAEEPATTENALTYRTTIETVRPPSHFTPRVVPHHPDAHVPVEALLIAWPS
jgi:starch phosphorylase